MTHSAGRELKYNYNTCKVSKVNVDLYSASERLVDNKGEQCTKCMWRTILPRCIVCKRGLGGCKAVRPSVSPSVRHTRIPEIPGALTRSLQKPAIFNRYSLILWQNERKFCRHSYTTWKGNSSSFLIRRMIGGDASFYLKFWVHWPGRFGDFQSIFALSASALRPIEKSSIITNKKSTTSFPMSLRWTTCVAPDSPKGLRNANWPLFPVKVYFCRRKSATVFLCVKLSEEKF